MADITQRGRPLRSRQLAAIHLAKKRLGLDEESYRAVLRNATGLESAGDMNDRQRGKVLAEMRRRGFDTTAASPVPFGTHAAPPRQLGARPHNYHTNPQYAKIEALLIECEKGWFYAGGISRNMYNKPAIEMCSSAELRGIITALEKHRRRHHGDEKETA